MVTIDNVVKWCIASENTNIGVSCLNGRFGVTFNGLLSYMVLKVYLTPFLWLDS